MDIEGSEYNALLGAEDIIKRDRPKLAICLYHTAEDYLRIPFLINKMVPEYELYIKHHEQGLVGTVLYAVDRNAFHKEIGDSLSGFMPYDFDRKLEVAQVIKELVYRGDHTKNIRYESITDRFISDIGAAKFYVDIGAELGYYACLADRYMPPGGEIHIFEPNPINFKILKSLYGSKSSFRLYENAVSNKKGNVVLYSSDEKASYSMDENPDKHMPAQDEYRKKGNKKLTFTTQSVVLDDLFRDTKIDIIKMDIEGAEVLAFEGMERILSYGHTKIFLELHTSAICSIRPDGLDYMMHLLDKYNYECFDCIGNEIITSDFCKTERAYIIPRKTSSSEHTT